MLIRRVIARYLQANCYLLSPVGAPVNDGLRDAIVVDPGAGSARGVRAIVESEDLRIAGVYLTHGHADHVWDAAAVAGDAPVFIGEPDLYRLDDPLAVRRDTDPDFSFGLTTEWVRPENVQILPETVLKDPGGELLPGFVMRTVPTPGHTEGSCITLFGLRNIDVGFGERQMPADFQEFQDPQLPMPDVVAARVEALGGTREKFPPVDERVQVALAGDVVFEGSIGRTDLAGGDPEAMDWSLRVLAKRLDPATVLLPGHGPATWWGRERATNPYVKNTLSAK